MYTIMFVVPSNLITIVWLNIYIQPFTRMLPSLANMTWSNTCLAPPTNLSTIHQWTVGPIFYASLVVAEAFGSSNASQIRDIGFVSTIFWVFHCTDVIYTHSANYGNIYTPAYDIYEAGAASRVALFNYLDDPTGASTISVAISVGGGQTGSPASVPASVQVKWAAPLFYLSRV